MFASRGVPDAAPDSPLAKAAEESCQLLIAGIAASGRIGPYGSAMILWAQLHGLAILKATDGFVAPPLDTFVSELAL